jgi:hypothetical protein
MLAETKKILIFSHDPGGANTVIPLVVPLLDKGYNVRLYGKEVALERYRQSGVDGINIMLHLHVVTLESVEQFLLQESPEFIITGTSAEDFTERYIWKAAERLGIPSFAILDQWVNYGIRFSPWGLSNSADYEGNPQHPFLPSRIIVMDEFAREEMARRDIIVRDHILPLGQPYFETLFIRQKSLPPVDDLRKRLGIFEDEFVITYVSEPLSHDYGEEPDRGEYWGFTERTIFRVLLESLGNIVELSGKKVRLIIKLHPRESQDNYDDLIRQQLQGVTVTLDHSGDPLEMIHVSDLVCGMSSMMLIEAAIVGTPILSILIGLRRESPFVLDRLGLLCSARSAAEVEGRLTKALSGNVALRRQFTVKQKPVLAIIEAMEKML